MKSSLRTVFIFAICITFLSSITIAQEKRPDFVNNREYPQWFKDAKLGIFIHFGLYSVPSWSGKEQYAEWFYKGLISGDSA
ncbi:MAG: alpha-L-fucosidase, partial [Bacteroidales bacterium]|nr:alpha-L-fucosidase [Bacteroidales bacterium]